MITLHLVIISVLSPLIIGKPIVEGEVSSIKTYPWLVSIQYGGYHHCGGSIISASIILTAAQCASNPPDSYIIRAGSTRTDSGGSWHSVTAIRRHENYREPDTLSRIQNDVALMKVTPSFKFNKNLKKIRLAEEGDASVPDTVVSIAGWGLDSAGGTVSYELRAVNLHIRNSARCAMSYGDDTGRQMDSNNTICATEYGSPGFCNRDQGGPLVTQGGLQVGIASWHWGCANLYPGVYMNVARYRRWINTNARILH